MIAAGYVGACGRTTVRPTLFADSAGYGATALEDDPSNDIPLKYALEGGVWRLENSDAYVSD